MKKKIDTNQIEIGMYVSEVDRPWRETPFLFQGFEIKDEEDIKELQKFCSYVIIDTDEGRDVDDKLKWRIDPLLATDTGEEKENKKKAPEGGYEKKTDLFEEMPKAREAERKTRNVIQTIMTDVRLGRSVDTSAAKEVVGELTESIVRNPDAMMCLSMLKEADEYTALHSLRVCILAVAFGRELGYSIDRLEQLGTGALLHDLGKLRIPLEILNKPGKLTTEEYDIIKSHVPLGVQVLEDSKGGIADNAIEVARYHHERIDGSGYVSGRSNGEIPEFGRIGGIVDCYDAITSDRIYKKGISAYDALKKMYEWRDSAFDGDLVEKFIQCMGIYPIGSLVEMNTGSIGVVATINRERRLRPKVVLVLTSDKKPFDKPKVIDMMEDKPGVRELEIAHVLASGTYGINPVSYLPIQI
ncbi:MAG: HD-GYP domain-containing protein [Acidiferrobacterales bacterium]|nr:HD-GYP domain-containing protein [Acidiferrobacterales bacterium]